MIGRKRTPRNGGRGAASAGEVEADPLDGSILREVHQPAPDAIRLRVYRPGTGEADWLLSVHPAAPRLARTFVRGRNPPRPGQFCQRLRARLVGGRLGTPETLGPQTLALPVTTGNDTEGRRAHYLVLEANGPHSNLLLLDAQRRLEVALRRPSLPGRRLVPGDAYEPPDKPDWLPAGCPLDGWRLGGDDRARAHEAACRALESAWALERLRRTALREARRRLKRLQRRKTHLERDLAQAGRAGRYREWGELLKIHGDRIPPGAEAALVPDEFDPARPEVRISLDPRATLAANIERLFGRYRKLRDARPHVARRLADTEREAALWAEIAAAIPTAPDRAALERLFRRAGARLPEPDAGHAGRRGRGGRDDTAGPPRIPGVLERLSSDGFHILVGRSGEANDRLTFRLANGRDWWLHAQGVPGAHVVVRSPSGARPPARTLREAAWLAAYFSPRRADRKVDVDLTQRKHVRKVRGGAPGLVTVTQVQTLLADLDDRAAAAVLDATETAED